MDCGCRCVDTKRRGKKGKELSAISISGPDTDTDIWNEVKECYYLNNWWRRYWMEPIQNWDWQRNAISVDIFSHFFYEHPILCSPLLVIYFFPLYKNAISFPLIFSLVVHNFKFTFWFSIFFPIILMCKSIVFCLVSFCYKSNLIISNNWNQAIILKINKWNYYFKRLGHFTPIKHLTFDPYVIVIFWFYFRNLAFFLVSLINDLFWLLVPSGWWLLFFWSNSTKTKRKPTGNTDKNN